MKTEAPVPGGDTVAVAQATGRYESAVAVSLAALAFLAKDNPKLDLPESLWLFLLLLTSSLAASLATRLRPERPLPAAAALVVSFVVVAGIQSHSGGAESDLWVLYLLPIFSAAILLGGRETVWISAGAVIANGASFFADESAAGAGEVFALALKTGILIAAAGATWSLAKAERSAQERVLRQRGEISRLEGVASVAAGSAGAVHDLGAPLTVILGYAGIRREDAALPLAVREDMACIERSARYCQEIVRALLSPRDQPARVRSASEVLESSLSICEEPLRARGVQIERRYPDETLHLKTVGHELERVLVNLLGNAAKAMAAGGRIVVSLSVSSRGARPEVILTVDDDGPGVSPELLPRLFSPFATTRAKEGGVGLGLYSCREIVRRHGGEMTASGSPQGGARFQLSLPAASAADGATLAGFAIIGP